MHKVMQATFSDCCGNLSKERTSETLFLFSDGLLAQTLRTAYVRFSHILVEFRFYMGYGLLVVGKQGQQRMRAAQITLVRQGKKVV